MPPRIMGIVNVTPDSFSDGGRLGSLEAAISHGLKLVEEGADVLDIGGESTRPGADPVNAAQEIDRVVPVIEGLSQRTAVPLSIDTMKPEVAAEAVRAGAVIWNDVTALTFSPDSPSTAARLGCDVILMHMQGKPQTMQADPRYGDVVAEVGDWLVHQASLARQAGVGSAKIWLDPGIGFGKTRAHNLALTAGLARLVLLGFPVLYGASRKRLIEAIDATATDPCDRLGGSLALALESARQGAAMIRVHDVRETCQALKVQAALQSSPFR